MCVCVCVCVVTVRGAVLRQALGHEPSCLMLTDDVGDLLSAPPAGGPVQRRHGVLPRDVTRTHKVTAGGLRAPLHTPGLPREQSQPPSGVTGVPAAGGVMGTTPDLGPPRRRPHPGPQGAVVAPPLEGGLAPALGGAPAAEGAGGRGARPLGDSQTRRRVWGPLGRPSEG